MHLNIQMIVSLVAKVKEIAEREFFERVCGPCSLLVCD